MQDWLYYLGALILCVANVAAWLGIWVRLPGHWIIAANSTLYMALFPPKINGLSFGWFTVGLLIVLASLGDSIAFAVKRHHLGTNKNPKRPLRGIITGAGLGSLSGALLGFAVPIIGSLIAILGSIGGAAGGAYLGAMLTDQGFVRPPVQSQLNEPQRPRLPFGIQIDSLKVIPRLVAGATMWLIATYGSFLG